MEDDLPEIDEKGLRNIARIERALRKLDPDDIGAFIAITNALEYHVERSPPHAETVRLLAQALRTYVASCGIEARAAGFAKPLEDLIRYAQ